MKRACRALCPIVGALAILAGCGNQGKAPGQQSAAAGDIPSCYATSGLQLEPPAPTRAIFVFVDQTTGLDDRLRETVRHNFEHLLVPGTAFTVSTFSAFSQGHYVTAVASGAVEAPVPDADRSSLPVRRLQNFDSCLAGERSYVLNQADGAIGRAMSGSSQSFSNSEIMASLSQLSQAVRASPATEKIVIVVSDLLEHSTTTTFYRNRDLRTIVPAEELAKAEESRLFGDFGGAHVAVVGAGLLSPEARSDAVRNARALAALHDFWEQWLRRSHGELTAYGQPDLVTAIQ